MVTVPWVWNGRTGNMDMPAPTPFTNRFERPLLPSKVTARWVHAFRATGAVPTMRGVVEAFASDVPIVKAHFPELASYESRTAVLRSPTRLMTVREPVLSVSRTQAEIPNPAVVLSAG